MKTEEMFLAEMWEEIADIEIVEMKKAIAYEQRQKTIAMEKNAKHKKTEQYLYLILGIVFVVVLGIAVSGEIFMGVVLGVGFILLGVGFIIEITEFRWENKIESRN